MSTGSTTNYSLHQWDKEDLFLMSEFNEDNQVIDEALNKASLVKLYSTKITSAANSVTIDLSNYALSEMSELRLHLNAWHNSSGLYDLNLTLNDTSSSAAYLTANLVSDTTLATGSAINLGKLCGSASNNHGGMEISIRLYTRGITVRSVGAACFSNSTMSVYDCVGIPGSTTQITRSNLTSLTLAVSDSSVKIAAGSTLVLYGVKE